MTTFANAPHRPLLQNLEDRILPAYLMPAIDFGAYIQVGENPDNGPGQITDAQLKARLGKIAPYTNAIRTYGNTGDLKRAGEIIRTLGKEAYVGAFLQDDDPSHQVEIDAANQAAVNELIGQGLAGKVDIAIVGSETLQRGRFSEAKLINYVDQVKAAFVGLGIPVTTADTYNALLAHPSVLDHVDIVFANFFPFHEGVPVEAAIPDLDRKYRQVQLAVPGKEVFVSESGWPSAGSPKGAAVPSPENAARYAREFVSWARANEIPFAYFAAIDEPWKVGEGDFGPHWGLLDASLNLKPGLEPIFEGVTVPPEVFAVASGAGNLPHVRVYNAATGAQIASFFAYDTGYIGGVRVAVADVNGDGTEDVITGTTPNTSGGHIKVIDGRKLNQTRGDGVILPTAELFSFFATPGFSGGVFVAGGDVNGDSKADIIVGFDAGMGGGLIRIYSGANGSVLREIAAFDQAFLGGVRVAAGDIDGDGKDDIIAGSGAGATPHVKVFSGSAYSLIRSFLAYDSAFMGGAFVASGFFNSDGNADIVTSAGGNVPHVKVYDGRSRGELSSFIADGALQGGPVGAVDRSGDGLAEILLQRAGVPSSQVQTIDPVSQVVRDQLFAFPGFLGDVFIG